MLFGKDAAMRNRYPGGKFTSVEPVHQYGCLNFMGRFAIACAIAFTALSGLAGGQPVNGLGMSVSIDDIRTGRKIVVKLENTGEKDLLVPIGVAVGKAHPVLLKLYVKTAAGPTRRVIYTALGAIAGYAEPWNIPLRPGESHTVRTPINSYYVLDGSEKLATFILRPCQLWVGLDHQDVECPAANKLRPVPCWHGKLVSNLLQLPN
jgi:hypothetical protein